MDDAAEQVPQRVVAAVDGHADGAVLAWAGAEAYAHGVPMTIHHCWRQPPGTFTSAGLTLPFATCGPRLSSAARITLEDAIEQALSRTPGITVEGELLAGPAGPTLSARVEPADLLVVGRRSTHRLAARLLGSTASYLLAHCRCTMVVVPPSVPVTHGPFGGHVVVGVADSAGSEAALRLGFAEAAAHRWPLAAVQVVAARETSSAIDEATLEVELIPFPSQYGLLQAAIEPWRHRYPDVAVRRACLSGEVSPALLRAAAGARLLVIGRHQRRVLRQPAVRLIDMLLARISSPVALTVPVHAAPATSAWTAGAHRSFAVW